MTLTNPVGQEVAAHFTFFQPDALSDPYADYSWMRKYCPVYYAEDLWMWCVFGYEDVAGIIRLPTTTKTAIRANFLRGIDLESTLGRYFTHIIFLTDDPGHRSQYRAVEQALTPLFKGIRPRVQHITDTLFGQVVQSGRKEVEVVSELAFLLPVTVIGILMGIPSEHYGQLRQWTCAMNDALDPSRTETHLRLAQVAVDGFFDFFTGVCEGRRRQPGDDLVTALARTLQGDELLATLVTLFIAAHESVCNSLSQGVLSFAESPAQWDLLRAERALLKNVPDELLRLHAPTTVAYRQLAEPYRCRDGVEIPAGAVVAAFLASGNRDETTFPDPDALDLRRPNSHEHLGFSAGSPHYCIGAPLARVEIMSFFETILNCTRGGLQILPPVRMRNTKLFRAIGELHLAFEPAAA